MSGRGSDLCPVPIFKKSEYYIRIKYTHVMAATLDFMKSWALNIPSMARCIFAASSLNRFFDLSAISSSKGISNFKTIRK